MEFDSRNLSSFSSTNDLNLSPSRKRTITKGKTINPHEDLEPCHSATKTSMVTQSTVSCQTRRNAFYCLNNNEEGRNERSLHRYAFMRVVSNDDREVFECQFCGIANYFDDRVRNMILLCNVLSINLSISNNSY